MGYVDVAGVGHMLPDGRELFADVSFRVGEGAKVALVGPNGAGKTTLLRMVAGDLPVPDGTIARSGGLGVMRQFIGMIGDETTLQRPGAVAWRRRRCGRPGERLAAAEAALHAAELRGKFSTAAGKAQTGVRRRARRLGRGRRVRRRGALRHRASASCSDLPWEQPRGPAGADALRRAAEAVRAGAAAARHRRGAAARRAGQLPRRAGQAVAGGAGCASRDKSVLYVSHDRELLAQTADRVVDGRGRQRLGAPGRLRLLARGPGGPHERLEELRRRWDEEHQKLRELVLMYKQKAAYNDGMASRLPGGADPAAQVRGGRPAAAAARRSRTSGCA